MWSPLKATNQPRTTTNDESNEYKIIIKMVKLSKEEMNTDTFIHIDTHNHSFNV